MKQFMGGGNTNSNSNDTPQFNGGPMPLDQEASYNPIVQNIAPIWPLDTSLDISIYVSPSLMIPELRSTPSEALVVQERGFRIGDWKDRRQIDTTFAVPKEVQNNATLWAHFFVAVSGHNLDPMDERYDPSKAYHFVRPLTQYLLKKKMVKTKKLLSSDATASQDEESQPQGRTIASYYHPNLTVSVIPDSGVLDYPNMHPALRQFVQLEATGARDASGQNGWYYPILFPNTFWQLRGHMTELNTTVKTLPLHMELNNLQNWKFSIYASIDESMKQTQRKVAAGGSLPGGGDGTELEEVKRILLDTNAYLLATTGIVSVLHMVFEMLAFKSDIVSPYYIPGFLYVWLMAFSPTGGIRKTTWAYQSVQSSAMSSCKPSYSCTLSTTARGRLG